MRGAALAQVHHPRTTEPLDRLGELVAKVFEEIVLRYLVGIGSRFELRTRALGLPGSFRIFWCSFGSQIQPVDERFRIDDVICAKLPVHIRRLFAVQRGVLVFEDLEQEEWGLW